MTTTRAVKDRLASKGTSRKAMLISDSSMMNVVGDVVINPSAMRPFLMLFTIEML